MKKFGQEVFKSELSEYIKAEELYVGAKVNVNGSLFVLLSADEYTLNYMERNADKVNLLCITLDLPQPSTVCVFLSPECFLHLATGFTLCIHTCGHE